MKRLNQSGRVVASAVLGFFAVLGAIILCGPSKSVSQSLVTARTMIQVTAVGTPGTPIWVPAGPNGQAVVLPTATYGPGTPTPTATSTFTPWVPQVINFNVNSPTPTPVNSPVPNMMTDLIVDSIANTGTAQGFFSIACNGTIVSTSGLAPGGGRSFPFVLYDNNGNSTWSIIPNTNSGVAGIMNYRLFTHGPGTPVPTLR